MNTFLKKWREILHLFFREYFTDGIGGVAASLTYYLLFAIFPFLIAISWLIGFLDLPAFMPDGQMAKLIPEEILGLINRTLVHMSETSSGAFLTFGLVFTFWFPLRAVKSLMASINTIYGAQGRRQRPVRMLLLTLFIVVLVPVQIVIMLVGESVLQTVSVVIPMAQSSIDLWTKLRFIPVTTMMLLFVSATYLISVQERLQVRYVIPGAVLCTVIWLLFSMLFAFYVENMGNYSLIYGSIGAIIALLVWMNVSMTSLLVGAEFNQALRTYDIRHGKTKVA